MMHWPHRLVLGTYLNIEDDEGRARDLIDAAFELGITAFDVADLYGDGAAERVLGQVLSRRPRHSYCLIGKVGRPTSLGQGLGEKHVQQTLARSLHHLRTSHLDVLLAHTPDPTLPITRVVDTFDGLISTGRIGAWGTSQFPPQMLLRLAHATAHERGMCVEQPSYSLRDRWIENGRLPTARGARIAVVPHSTLSGGILTGKYRQGVPEGSRAMAHPHALRVDADARADAQDIVAITATYGIRPEQAALGWVLTQPGIAGAVIGARTPKQLESLVKAANHRPEPALQRALAQRFPGPSRRRDRLRAAAWHLAGQQVAAVRQP